MKQHKNDDHVVLEGRNNILLSAPHGVSQVRLGKPKFSEIGSLATALCLALNTNCHLIAKTKNNFDDANFDEQSEYKNSVEKIIKAKHIKYVIDFHGLASKRMCDINLGTHLCDNIKNDEYAFNVLYNSLTQNGFVTFIDQPFMGGSRTISGFVTKQHPNMWSLQIEINCSITNKKENIEKFNKLLKILTEWIRFLEKN